MIQFLWLACLVYDLMRPVSSGQILYPVLLVLTILSISQINRPSSWLRVSVYFLGLAILIMAFVGALHGNAGFNQQVTQWIGAPIIWTLWALSISDRNIRVVLTTITAATGVLALLVILYVGSQRGLIPSVVPSSILNGQGAAFNQTDQGSEIRLYGLSTLVAAGPLVVSMAIAPAHRLLPRRALCLIVAPLAVVAAIIAGRRAILVVTFVVPLLALIIGAAVRNRRRALRIPPWVVGVLPLPAFIGIYALMSSSAGSRIGSAISDAINFSAGSAGESAKGLTDSVRIQEGAELTQAWSSNSYFGSGLGATLNDGYYRDPVHRWNFELQYQLLLFNGGILGVLLVLIAVFSTVQAAFRIIKIHPEFLPVLQATGAAAVSILIGNATDPYLQAVGHGWGVALFVGVLNALYNSTDAEGGQSTRPGQRRAAPATHPALTSQPTTASQTLGSITLSRTPPTADHRGARNL